MKNKVTGLILCLLLIAVNAAGQEQRSSGQANRIPVNQEIITLIADSGKNLDELRYFLSEPLTIIIDDGVTESAFNIRNGAIVFTDQYMSSRVIQLSVNHGGRLHVYYDVPAGSEIFEIIFNVENRYVGLKFKRNPGSGNFIAFSAVINGRLYNLEAESGLPSLMIVSNLNLR